MAGLIVRGADKGDVQYRVDPGRVELRPNRHRVLPGLQQFMGHARFETTRAYIDEYDAEELALALRPRTAQKQIPRRKTLRKRGGIGGRYWI